MTRSVLFDTETTGLDPAGGHRVIEIAAIELIRDLPTQNYFHVLIDPERDVPDEVVRIHGITTARVRGQKRFADIADALLAFLGDGRLIAHNAPFDFGFLDAEFARIGAPPLDRARMVDTVAMARARDPGLPASLDALCRRFAIDLSARTTHNALLDCRLLADVYVELTGGRQRGLGLAAVDQFNVEAYAAAGPRHPVLVQPSDADTLAHQTFLARLKDPVWTSA